MELMTCGGCGDSGQKRQTCWILRLVEGRSPVATQLRVIGSFRSSIAIANHSGGVESNAKRRFDRMAPRARPKNKVNYPTLAIKKARMGHPPTHTISSLPALLYSPFLRASPATMTEASTPLM